ncbi:phosphopantothenoylcysteine decarboxylase [Ignicoccus pacificus DSM 13166]|uniref:Coenzyme A biosynthesis bifunctional protein CoaBC n=1 Tax=Ignicoccus pacificus DSM 13166 TaxID=940294 RepID=A0A977PKQ2_9CREN|nr:phosphopantothenoylcysteine decarboxylase [Ignicoccus pacificus DSM 13166]
MHPVEEIVGSKWRSLMGKCILLGVSYSVSLYKSVDLARELIKRGAKVKVMMTKKASEIVSPELFHWATGNKPIVDLTGETEHVSLAKECDLMLISPATLNVSTKLAWGIADENIPLTAINFLGYQKKVIVTPVMHKQMTLTPQYRETISRLREMGVRVLEPVEEDGRLKIPDVEFIANVAETLTLRDEDFKGKKVLVTSGPTREYIDRIRFISNPSSGKMGAALAWELFARGADVVVVHGPSIAKYPPWVKKIAVETTEEMAEVVKELGEFDMAFFAAAPADYRPKNFFDGKLDSKNEVTLELVPTPKVALNVNAKRKVGFTAVVGEDVIDTALQKLQSYNFDMIVANRVDRKDIGFTSDMNEVFIITKDGKVRHVPKMPKLLVARSVVDEAKGLL